VSASGQTCLIGFFGVPRGLQWTTESLRRNVFRPLADFGFACTRVAHFNRPDVVHSPRSGELNVPLELTGIEQLELELAWLEPQDAAHIAGYLPTVMRFPLKGEEDPEGLIRANSLHQLRSLGRLASLIDLFGRKPFDLYCLLRADLMYVDPLPVAEIVDMMKSSVELITPAWQRHSGLNDRMAFGSQTGANVYLNRVVWLFQHCIEEGAFHPESLLRFSVERAGLRHGFTRMRAKRVRATGAIVDEDFSF